VRDLQPYVGRSLEAKIIELDKNRNNVVLSRRAWLEETQKEQREDFLANLKPGEVRKGVVSSVVNFGAFVDLGGMDGLIHVSELSWKHVDHPGSVVPWATRSTVQVLEVDLDRERISLSLKATQQDPWQEFATNHRVGELVYGRVTKLVPFGAFVQVGDGIEGLVHISEMSAHHVDLPEQVVTPGEELWVKIIDLDLQRRRISLSIKQAAEGGVVAAEYQEHFGEHAYDDEGNYIGPQPDPKGHVAPSRSVGGRGHGGRLRDGVPAAGHGGGEDLTHDLVGRRSRAVPSEVGHLPPHTGEGEVTALVGRLGPRAEVEGPAVGLHAELDAREGGVEPSHQTSRPVPHLVLADEGREEGRPQDPLHQLLEPRVADPLARLDLVEQVEEEPGAALTGPVQARGRRPEPPEAHLRPPGSVEARLEQLGGHRADAGEGDGEGGDRDAVHLHHVVFLEDRRSVDHGTGRRCSPGAIHRDLDGGIVDDPGQVEGRRRPVGGHAPAAGQGGHRQALAPGGGHGGHDEHAGSRLRQQTGAQAVPQCLRADAGALGLHQRERTVAARREIAEQAVDLGRPHARTAQP
jgi:predicted RNA-binding protein with RPS1 domain